MESLVPLAARTLPVRPFINFCHVLSLWQNAWNDLAILLKLIAKIVLKHRQFNADAPLAHVADNTLLLQAPLVLRSIVALLAQAARYVRKLARAFIFQHSGKEPHISFREFAKRRIEHLTLQIVAGKP